MTSDSTVIDLLNTENTDLSIINLLQTDLTLSTNAINPVERIAELENTVMLLQEKDRLKEAIIHEVLVELTEIETLEKETLELIKKLARK